MQSCRHITPVSFALILSGLSCYDFNCYIGHCHFKGSDWFRDFLKKGEAHVFNDKK